MPTAPLKACHRCGARYAQRCPTCTKQARERQDERRGSSHQRGYGQSWRTFRPVFISLLVHSGIIPACGAALPTGPDMRWSKCQELGRVTVTDLELDHEPALEAWERTDPGRVCDPNRVGFYCHQCHSRKTMTEWRTKELS